MSSSSSQSEEKPGTTNSSSEINTAIIKKAENTSITINVGGVSVRTGITMSLLRLLAHV